MAYTIPGATRERVYRFVRQRLLCGNPPTVRDVQLAMGFRAVQSARSQLEALVAEGRLIKSPGRARGYALPGAAANRPPMATVPVVGQVQAGELTFAAEQTESYLSVEDQGDGQDLFALVVRGDSMVGAGILAGDTVIVRRQTNAVNGDIVVALVGEEATVKRLRRKGRRLELHPENPGHRPIVPDPAETTILGRVIEVRRRL